MDRTMMQEFFYWKRAKGNVFPPSFKREIRANIRNHFDPLEKSILAPGCWRMAADKECCEGWYEYTIIEDHGETDEELNFIFQKMCQMPVGYSHRPAKPFTRYIHWHRVSCGIVVIHSKAFDLKGEGAWKENSCMYLPSAVSWQRSMIGLPSAKPLPH